MCMLSVRHISVRLVWSMCQREAVLFAYGTVSDGVQGQHKFRHQKCQKGSHSSPQGLISYVVGQRKLLWMGDQNPVE